MLAFYDKTPEYRPRILSAQGDASQYPESLVNTQLATEASRQKHPNLRLQVSEKWDTVLAAPGKQSRAAK